MSFTYDDVIIVSVRMAKMVKILKKCLLLIKTTKTFAYENNNDNENNNSEDHDEVPDGDEGSTTHAASAAPHYSDDPEELKIIYVICKGGLLTDTQTLLLKIETFTMGKHFFQPLCLRLFLS